MDQGMVEMEEKIKIKYHVKELEKLRYIDGKSDWIDLRVELPKGYEMWILPRSSAFKNFGVIQTNAMGVVDESFCGDNDIIHMPILAMRDTEMHINDRIGQFRIAKHQAEIHFVEVEHLNHADRGGFGTTGKS